MSSEAALVKLDEAAAQGCSLTRNLKSSFSGALAVARVAQQIRNALSTDIVQEVIMPLKECDFGWRTDEKHDKRYSLEQIRDAWVDAALKGAVPVNNEVNIISGRAYLCKNYFTRMIREFPGLTKFVAIPGKVVMLPTGALVEYTATWELNGKPMMLARVEKSAIPVRLNAGMGADGALGKAERKLKAGVFSMITGSTFDDDEDDFISEVKPQTVVVERKEPPMPQNVLPDPTAAKAGTTQTKATTEKLKKEKPAAKVESTPSAATTQAAGDSDPAPWEGGGETAAVDEPKKQESAPAADTKVVGWVKNTSTGQMEEVRKPKTETAPAPTQATPQQEKKPEPPPAASENAGSGEVQRDSIGQIAAIKAKNVKGEGPYRVVSNNATEYWTDSKEMALKAKGYKGDGKIPGTPVSIDYVVDAEGKNQIVDILPEDFGSGEEEPLSDDFSQ